MANHPKKHRYYVALALHPTTSEPISECLGADDITGVPTDGETGTMVAFSLARTEDLLEVCPMVGPFITARPAWADDIVPNWPNGTQLEFIELTRNPNWTGE